MAESGKKNKPSEPPYKMESIYVTNKFKAKALPEEDRLLMAIKLLIPQRNSLSYDPNLKLNPKVDLVYCITIETKNHSALLLSIAPSNSSHNKVKLYLDGIKIQLINVLKSTHEKVYFIDLIQLKADPFHGEAFLSYSAHYAFLTQQPGFTMTMGLFILDKFKDEDRFLPVSMEMMDLGLPAENDMYLRLRKNNRFIKYVQKGGKLDQRQKSRLEKRGVKDLYIPADQPLHIQQQKVNSYLQSMLKEFFRSVG